MNKTIIPDLLNVPDFEREYCHLKETCYLDHTGAALYSQSQVEAVAKDLRQNLLSNPHSNSMPSRLCCDSVDQVRYRILQHFNTTSDEYSVIFTSGATAALKVVAENFEFSEKISKQLFDSISTDKVKEPCGEFVYLQDNHTSVLGMRNVDNIVLNNVPVRCLPHSEAFTIFSQHGQNGISTIEKEHYSGGLNVNSSVTCQSNCNNLFVFPAQCNFSGLKYPLTWIQQVQNGILAMNESCKNRRLRWFCLLDAATFVSTNPLDLSAYKPDFVTLSFYKIFGLPTGLGALLVLNSSAPVLRKRYYGGGTVQIALSSSPTHVLRPTLQQQYEDGTINFLSIVALRHGMDWQARSGISMPLVTRHCFSLACYTQIQLRRLRHSNGQAAVYLYADTAYDNPDTQGGIINFNMLRNSGEFVGYIEVLTLANLHNIHLRTGCFCNPGACQRLLGISDEQYYKNFEAGHVCGDDHDLIDGRPTGSVRVSFGPYSRQSDSDRLMHMLIDCFVSKPALYREPENWKETVKNYQEKFIGGKVHQIIEEPNSHQSNEHSKIVTGNKDEIDFKCYELTSKASETSLDNISFPSITVSQVCLYPIKSCGALSVHSWPLDDRGLMYDRCWMVVTASGVALTQKQEIRLCLIKPLIDLQKGVLTLTFKNESNCSVPLETPQSAGTAAWLCESKVCGDNVRGTDCGADVSKWLCHVLQRDCLRLIRQSSSGHRVASRKSQDDPVASLALSNQAQFLLVNENSVSWLTEKLPIDSDCPKTNMVDRFRSNFVVKGDCPAFEEQTWSSVNIGAINFTVDGPCGRCQMICINQSTGNKTKEPLTTLAANCHGKMKFGIYLRQDSFSENACVTVGDKITPSFY